MTLQYKKMQVPIEFFKELENLKKVNNKRIQILLRKYPRGHELFSRDQLISSYKEYCEKGLMSLDSEILDVLKLKPSRTMSGVTVITVLTKPYPCPGKCIFCPNDIRMPKSYISSEPGAQRAARNAFDPYLQTYNRLLALKNIGHNTEKIELIVLGGTWSFYPIEYKIWFIKRCFEAMNDFGVTDGRIEKASMLVEDPMKDKNEVVTYNSKINFERLVKNESATWEELFEEQLKNQNAKSRNVGLVLETRPDYISPKEIQELRQFGATKIQIGVQSLNDIVLEKNQRGTTRAQIVNAVNLIRSAGFKIHAHWMPNLYGSSIEIDKQDYLDLFELVKPDELKIYPTSIIKGTLLYKYFNEGKYKPYSNEELIELLKFCLKNTPKYCRLTRIIRDIPSNEIEAGNKTTNLRQIIENELIKEGTPCQCIRCREVKNTKVIFESLGKNILAYKSQVGTDYFITLETENKIAGFLRLFLSDKNESIENELYKEVKDSAIIREVHVYGQVVGIGKSIGEKTQHTGVGKTLVAAAEEIAINNKFKKISVISAIGTREYYKKLGYTSQKMFQTKEL